jgi:enoyl-CoA hydratase
VLIHVVERAGIVSLRVPRPVRSAEQAEQLSQEVRGWCAELEQRDSLPRGVVLTGSDDAFCIGWPATSVELDQIASHLAAAVDAIGRLQPPTLAALGADALGPAWELALACDLRLAAEDVHVGSPEVRLQRLPSCGGSQRLARLTGAGTALRLLLLGEVVSAPEALALGMVHRVGPRAELPAIVREVTDILEVSAPVALAYAKELVHTGAEVPLRTGLRLETDLSVLLQTTTDRAEGIAAFLERRPAHFDGH